MIPPSEEEIKQSECKHRWLHYTAELFFMCTICCKVITYEEFENLIPRMRMKHAIPSGTSETK